jgi:hypothetical protein
VHPPLFGGVAGPCRHGPREGCVRHAPKG